MASSENGLVERAKCNALKTMKEAGFDVSDKLKVVIDPKLPFMGYSTKRNGRDIVVVSGMALKSKMLEGLLIHEMSHIYRTSTDHPSHDPAVLNKVASYVMQRSHLTRDYQVAVVHQAINHIEDLYADDVAFQAFNQSGAFRLDQVYEFFLDWINEKPVRSKKAKTTWLNIGLMLNNCFVISNMTRHGVLDVDNQAGNKVQEFLSQTSERMKQGFVYFKDFMMNLQENVTEKEFEESLTDYLTRIAELANARADQT